MTQAAIGNPWNVICFMFQINVRYPDWCEPSKDELIAFWRAWSKPENHVASLYIVNLLLNIIII